jgi:hypothetical protein
MRVTHNLPVAQATVRAMSIDTLGFSIQAPGSVNEGSRTGPLGPIAQEEMQRGTLKGRISPGVGRG